MLSKNIFFQKLSMEITDYVWQKFLSRSSNIINIEVIINKKNYHGEFYNLNLCIVLYLCSKYFKQYFRTT